MFLHIMCHKRHFNSDFIRFKGHYLTKKEQPVFQGCPFILSNPTRQDVMHQPLHRIHHAALYT